MYINKLKKNTRLFYGIYGFILPVLSGSNTAVDSFNHATFAAPTAAGNQVLATRPLSPRMNFEVAQSRLGFEFGSKEAAEGFVEFDFIDFTKSSPTTTMVPRVRRAFVTAQISDSLQLLGGQDWTLFNGVHPFTYNYVGHYFSAGDAGFMRQQFQIKYKANEMSYAFAVGLPSANANGVDGVIEQGMAPVFEAQIAHTNDNTTVGIAGTYVQMLNDLNSLTGFQSYGVALFADLGKQATSTLSAKVKAYCGQNLNNIGMLSLSFGNASNSVQECGGYITPKYALSEKVSVFGGFGYSVVLSGTVSPAYTFSATTNTYSLGTSGPGMKNNMRASLGLDHEIAKSTKAFYELSYFASTMQLNANEISLGYSATPSSMVVQTGIQYTL